MLWDGYPCYTLGPISTEICQDFGAGSMITTHDIYCHRTSQMAIEEPMIKVDACLNRRSLGSALDSAE